MTEETKDQKKTRASKTGRFFRRTSALSLIVGLISAVMYILGRKHRTERSEKKSGKPS